MSEYYANQTTDLLSMTCSSVASKAMEFVCFQKFFWKKSLGSDQPKGSQEVKSFEIF